MVLKDDPGLHRRQVRNGLKDARAQAGRTQQDVADQLDWSLSKVIRIENGTNTISITDLKAMLSLYGVDDANTVAGLVAAARASRRKPWWYEFHELIRPQFAELLSHEAGARSIRAFSPTIITALLQTDGYARALRAETIVDQAKRDRLVDLLVKRQALLREDNEVVTHFIVAEAALHLQVGGPAVMTEQLGHLLQCMQSPQTTVRVLPYTAGAHPALSGSVVLLQLADEDNDVVFLEGAEDDVISHDDALRRETYNAVFQRLESKALGQDASADLIRKVQESYR
ncbi:helix-turn-helix domain-containing protein [Actinospica robiniae]|uniref:helix-turn-helix domain-containing protein n=1 Tax=Actinospica robiniae TaxID=304901 RepID=UPI00041F652C|nr:helix-turn-helix transcriptional regulator [Actinospica robiniae]